MPEAKPVVRPGDRSRLTTRIALSILVWLLFGIVVLGPLLTILVASFVSNLFQDTWQPTLEWYGRIARDPLLLGPLLRSLEIAVIVVVVQLLLGSLVAFSTVRDKIIGSRALDAMSNITIALPSVVVGLALLAFYSGSGPAAAFTNFAFGDPLSITWTLWIVVLAHVLETFPYMVRAISGGLVKLNPQLESAARSLGARNPTVFFTITLPQLRSSLVGGAVLVFARSIAEFGATVVVVAAVLGTAPTAIYVNAEAGLLELASAYSVVLMMMSLIAYLALSRGLLESEKKAMARG